MAYLQLVEPQANGLAANAQVTGDAFPLPYDGWIVLAGVPPLTGGGFARVRAKIEVLGPTVASDGSRSVIGSIWVDYARASGQALSVPNIPVKKSWAVRLVCAASSGWTTGRVTAQVWVSQTPPGGQCYIHQTPDGPDAGPGDFTTVDINDPATGTQYGLITTGARTLERVAGFVGSLTTDATAIGREMSYFWDDGTNGNGRTVSTSVGASTTFACLLGGAQGAPNSDDGVQAIFVVRQCGLPTILMRPGFRHRPIIQNLAAGDELTQGFSSCERWAVIL